MFNLYPMHHRYPVIGLNEYCQPELTTISQPRDEIGRCAMRLLLDVLRKKQVPHQQVLNTQLIVRASTAQAPKPCQHSNLTD